jgi:hypothetical protein
MLIAPKAEPAAISKAARVAAHRARTTARTAGNQIEGEPEHGKQAFNIFRWTHTKTTGFKEKPPRRPSGVPSANRRRDAPPGALSVGALGSAKAEKLGVGPNKRLGGIVSKRAGSIVFRKVFGTVTPTSVLEQAVRGGGHRRKGDQQQTTKGQQRTTFGCPKWATCSNPHCRAKSAQLPVGLNGEAVPVYGDV